MLHHNSLELFLRDTANLQNDAMLPKLGKMEESLTPLDVMLLEKSLGKLIALESIDALYAILVKRYFKTLVMEEGISAKKQFQKTVRDLLKSIQQQKNVSLSSELFLQALSGKNRTLANGADWRTVEEHHWLEAVQYAYHLETKPLPEDPKEMLHMVHTAATFFSLIQDYDALEKLFDIHKQFLIQEDAVEKFFVKEKVCFYNEFPFSLMEASCLFYATYGHFNKIKPLLNAQLLAEDQFSLEVYAVVCIHAAKQGQLEILKLIETIFNSRGGILSLKDKGNALSGAALNGHLKVVEFLLESVENMAFEEKGCVFDNAVKGGGLEVTQLLLERWGHEISLNHQGVALCSALHQKNTAIVNSLLTYFEKKGNAVEALGLALCNAAEQGYQDMITLLLNQCPGGRVISDQHQGRALANALCLGREDASSEKFSSMLYPTAVIRLLMTHAQKRGKVAVLSGWALYYAAVNKDQAAIYFILDHLTQEIPEACQRWALYDAIQNKHLEIVMCLLNHPLLLTLKTIALHHAVSSRNLGIVQFLQSTVGDMFSIEDKKQAFLNAVVCGHMHIITFFLVRLEEVRSAECIGTALCFARNKNHTFVVDQLLDYANEQGNILEVKGWALCSAVLHRYQEVVSYLLEHASWQVIPERYQRRALTLAVRKEYLEIATLLLEHPALSALKITVLRHAVMNENFDNVSLLPTKKDDVPASKDMKQALREKTAPFISSPKTLHFAKPSIGAQPFPLVASLISNETVDACDLHPCDPRPIVLA